MIQALFSTQKILLAISTFNTIQTYSCRKSASTIFNPEDFACLHYWHKKTASIIFNLENTTCTLVPSNKCLPLFPMQKFSNNFVHNNQVKITFPQFSNENFAPYILSWQILQKYFLGDGKRNTCVELSLILLQYTVH